MLRASVLLMYSCVWGWMGCGEFLLVSLMGDILGGWWGVYSSTCQCWITQTRWLPLQLLQDKPRSLEGWSVKSPVISMWPQAASMENKKAESLTLRGTLPPNIYSFMYLWRCIITCAEVVCHNSINHCGILQQIKNGSLNRGHTLLFQWSQLVEGRVLHLLSLSNLWECFWKEGVEVW